MTRIWNGVTRLVRGLVGGLAVGLLVVPAGCGNGDTTEAEESPEVAGEIVTFVASDLEFTEAPEQMPSGEVTIELVNEADVVHNVTIEELDDLEVVEAGAGETATGAVTLEPGSYTYYCSIPGHREAGMEGTVTVE